MRLKNKVAVITGAAHGIGLAIAELFVQEGAIVVMTDKDDSAGERACKQINENYGHTDGCTFAEYVHVDVSREDDWHAIEQYLLEKYNGIDVLVNNAGITGLADTTCLHDPEHFDLDAWRKVHATNLDGVALGCKMGIALMKHRSTDPTSKSSIINISSRSGIVGVPAAAAYASTKAAVRNHTKTVALYCAAQGYNIRCNSIHPAAINTRMWDDMFDPTVPRETSMAQLAKGIPLGHMGEPIDVAYAAVYLASDEAKYVTGIELNVDGGILAGGSAAPRSNK
ncbi:SDR family oxidoreductase [Corynebacterium sp. HS2168-gen11]|uniref:SDR family oxidoreductase n=1 Tax=Corynebacterium sp. HS2168-gen11 TaxID=2974027 RepID=UPI00216AC742|nr:SDR family oxidoreductase [Corynebacterium sp. HS2168-gen11]MCS4535414.1 SDR family oxidoreductase [Corynebacterium sp. HS2168-gen11]